MDEQTDCTLCQEQRGEVESHHQVVGASLLASWAVLAMATVGVASSALFLL